MGRVDRRPADYRCDRAAKNGNSAARNPLRKICARIHPRNEKRPTGLQEAAARSSKSPYRNCRPEASRSYELEEKKQKQLAHAAAGQRAITPTLSRRKLLATSRCVPSDKRWSGRCQKADRKAAEYPSLRSSRSTLSLPSCGPAAVLPG